MALSSSLAGLTASILLMPLAAGQGDTCAAPNVAVLGANAYDTSGLTTSSFDGGGVPCLSAPGVLAGPHEDGFFVFTVAAGGDYAFDTLGTSADTVLQVHSGVDCSATCLAGDDDGASLGLGESRVLLKGRTAGESLLLQVGTWSAEVGGPGTLNINTYSPPSNDDCSSPIALGTFLGTTSWDNTLASSSSFDGGGGGGICGAAGSTSEADKDLFYTWDCPANGNYTFSTVGTVLDGALGEVLSLHLGGDCTASCVASFDGPTPATTIVAGAVTGETYLVQVGGWLGNYGAGGLLTIGLTPPPDNNDCSAPEVVTVGSIVVDLSNATTSNFVGGGIPCPATGSGLEPTRDAFFQWSVPADGDYQIDTLGLNVDTILNLHLGADCAATCLFSSDWGNGDSQSLVEVLGATTGTDYLVQLGLWEQETLTNTVLNISTLGRAPANDTCAMPMALAGLGTTPFDNTTAHSSFFDGGGAPCLGPNNPVATQEVPTNDLFYTWSALISADYRIDTVGSGIDTILGVHLGSDCAATCFAADDNSGGALQSRVDLLGLTAGQTFLVQVGTWVHESTATGVLNITILTPAPTNDTCATPTPLLGETAFVWDNSHPLLTTSNFDGGDPLSCMSPVNPDPSATSQAHYDLFYSWTAECDQDYLISTAGSPIVTDTKLSVHLGSDCSAVCVASNDDIDLAGGDFLSELMLTGVLAGETYLIQVGLWNDAGLRGEGTLSITGLTGGCAAPITIVCDPALDHYLGNNVKLDTSYLGSGVESGFHLEALDGPANQFGFVLVAAGASLTIPVFEGILCLDAPAGRYTGNVAINQGVPGLNSICQFDASGVLQNLVGTSTVGSGFDVPVQLPFTPSGQTIAPGDVYCFQVWYRDQDAGGMPSANFSNVVCVPFP
jgi:hypothetical protein